MTGLKLRVITVVGRASTDRDFASSVDDLLYDGYSIFIIHPLGEPGIDKKERFLALVSAIGPTEHDFETQVSRLNNSEEIQFGVKLFDSMDEALDFSKETYGLKQDKVRQHEILEKIQENYPPLTAEEIEQYGVVDALIRTNRITVVPARFDGERAVVICQVTAAAQEMRITPLALLLTEEIVDRLELPHEEMQ